MSRLIRKILCFLLLFTAAEAMGQARFSATVTPREIGKEEYTQLRLLVENAADVRQIAPPSLKDFIVVSGPSQESGMSNINGSMSQYTGVSYLLKPRRTGTFTIPSAIALADGKKLTSQPVTVKVTNAATGNGVQPGAGFFSSPFAGMDPFEEPERPAISEDMVLKEGEDPKQKIGRNMFVKLETDKTSCYVGEPIVATYKLYTRLPSESNMTKNPSFNGFSVIDLQQPGNNEYYRERLNGKEYNVYTIRKAQLYPLQAGTLDLEIAEIENNIRFIKAAYAAKGIGSGSSTMGLPPEALINQKIVLQSQPMSINVKALPDAGKPANFKGAVGEFGVEAMLAKKEFTTDDAGTLRIVISGQGNLQLVTAPEISWPAGMESFDAKTTDDLYKGTVPVSGRKTIDYPFTVAEPGTYTLPPVQFSFFNPKTRKYKTVSTEPVSFTVAKGTGEKHYDTPEPVTKDRSLLSRFFSNRLRVVSVVACLILLGLIFWLKRDKKTEEKKIAEQAIAAEKEKAEMDSIQELLEQQKNPLAEAELALEANDSPVFYKHLDEELRKYLSHKLHIPQTELNKKSIAEELDRNGISNETCLLLHQLLDEIEWQRYTPFSSNEKMMDTYEKANAMIQLINTYKT